MDPVSIIAASISTVELILKLGDGVGRVIEVWKGVQQVDLRVQDLRFDLDNLLNFLGVIYGAVESSQPGQYTLPRLQQKADDLDSILQAAVLTFSRLEKIFVDVTRQRAYFPSIRQYYRFDQYKEEIESIRARIGIYISSLACAAAILTPPDLSGEFATLSIRVQTLESCINKLGVHINGLGRSVQLMAQQQRDATARQVRASTAGKGPSRRLSAISVDDGAWKSEALEEDMKIKVLAEKFVASVRYTASTLSLPEVGGSAIGDPVDLGGTGQESSFPAPPPNSTETGSILRRPPPRPRKPARLSTARVIHHSPQPVIVESAVDQGERDVDDAESSMAQLSIHPPDMNPERREEISLWAEEASPEPEPQPLDGPLQSPRAQTNRSSSTAKSASVMSDTPSKRASTSRTSSGREDAMPMLGGGELVKLTEVLPGPLEGHQQHLLHMAEMCLANDEYDRALKPLYQLVEYIQTTRRPDEATCQKVFDMVAHAIVSEQPFGDGEDDGKVSGYPEVVARVIEARYNYALLFFNQHRFNAARHVLDACLGVRPADRAASEPSASRVAPLEPIEERRYKPRLDRTDSRAEDPSRDSGSAVSQRRQDGENQVTLPHIWARRPGVSSGPIRYGAQAQDQPDTAEPKTVSFIGWKEVYCLPIWDEIHILSSRAMLQISPGSSEAEVGVERILEAHRGETPLRPEIEFTAKHLLAESRFAANDYPKAKSLAKEAAMGRQRLLGASHRHTRQSVALLLAICQEADDNEQMYWQEQTDLSYERLEPTTIEQRLAQCQDEMLVLAEQSVRLASELGAWFLYSEFDCDVDEAGRVCWRSIKSAIREGNGNFLSSTAITEGDSMISGWPIVTYLIQSKPLGGGDSCSVALDYLIERLKSQEKLLSDEFYSGAYMYVRHVHYAILQGKTADVEVLLKYYQVDRFDLVCLMRNLLNNIRPDYSYPEVSKCKETGVSREPSDELLSRQLKCLALVMDELTSDEVKAALRSIVAFAEEDIAELPALLDNFFLLAPLLDKAGDPNMSLPRRPTPSDESDADSPLADPVDAPLLHHLIGRVYSPSLSESARNGAMLALVDLAPRADRGRAALQVALSEARAAEDAGHAKVVADVVALLREGVDLADPTLGLRELYKGDIAEIKDEFAASAAAAAAAGKQSKLARMFARRRTG